MEIARKQPSIFKKVLPSKGFASDGKKTCAEEAETRAEGKGRECGKAGGEGEGKEREKAETGEGRKARGEGGTGEKRRGQGGGEGQDEAGLREREGKGVAFQKAKNRKIACAK